MRFKIYIFFERVFIIIFSVLLIGCEHKSDKIRINPNKVIEFAEVIKYEDLNQEEKEKLKYGCRYYPSNWNNGVEFRKEDAYYVRARINVDLLADLSASSSFPKVEIIRTDIHPTYVYGKYKNRWIFLNEKGNPIEETSKFEGHEIISISRTGLIDHLVIGAIPEKPSKMMIKILQSENYPNLTPEFSLKDSLWR